MGRGRIGLDGIGVDGDGNGVDGMALRVRWGGKVNGKVYGWPHLRNRYVPLPGLLFPLLLDRVREHLRMRHAFTVKQVRRHCVLVLWLLRCLVLIQTFLVLFDRLLHLRLLRVALLVILFRLEAAHSFRNRRAFVPTACLLLALLLFVV